MEREKVGLCVQICVGIIMFMQTARSCMENPLPLRRIRNNSLRGFCYGKKYTNVD